MVQVDHLGWLEMRDGLMRGLWGASFASSQKREAQCRYKRSQTHAKENESVAIR